MGLPMSAKPRSSSTVRPVSSSTSIGGAAAHNIGQIGAAMIVLGGTAVLGYLPVLLAVSLLTGTLTGFVAGLLFRAMKNVKLSR